VPSCVQESASTLFCLSAAGQACRTAGGQTYGGILLPRYIACIKGDSYSVPQSVVPRCISSDGISVAASGCIADLHNWCTSHGYGTAAIPQDANGAAQEIGVRCLPTLKYWDVSTQSVSPCSPNNPMEPECLAVLERRCKQETSNIRAVGSIMQWGTGVVGLACMQAERI